MIQSLIWRIRWQFDRKWRVATSTRVLRERRQAEQAGKTFKLTALRRFVLGRL